MQITKNRLDTDGVPSLTVRSENYQVRIFYNGNYKKDFSEKTIDNMKVTVSCETLSQNVLPISISDGTVVINGVMPESMPLTKMDPFMDKVLRTRDEMVALQHIYDAYFNPGRRISD